MGFLMGPLFALILAVINALLQIMFMGGGPVDVIMNVISTATFAVTAAFIYRRMHTKTGAFIGLVSGTLLCIASMAVWNYVVDPYYFQISQEVVAGMIPAISLFNLIKCGLNAGITLFVYKPVVTALRKAGLAKPSESREGTKGMAWAGAFAALTAAILAASLNGLI
jgi:riboflavin transporter FmnP